MLVILCGRKGNNGESDAEIVFANFIFPQIKLPQLEVLPCVHAFSGRVNWIVPRKPDTGMGRTCKFHTLHEIEH